MRNSSAFKIMRALQDKTISPDHEDLVEGLIAAMDKIDDLETMIINLRDDLEKAKTK